PYTKPPDPADKARRSATKPACGPVQTPAPFTWALLILGFGAMGAAIRSRRFRRLSPA
ncbi:MAG: PEP-CTERM sorting domain-containing protein, partial [Phenylobacterium sp.]